MKLLVAITIIFFGLTSLWANGLTEREQELLGALKLAREYANGKSYPEDTYLVYTPPAAKLREYADRIDQEEKDIAYIDSIIKKYEEAK